MKQYLPLVASGLLLAGCGFKSDLYLPEREAATTPEIQRELPELPPLPSSDADETSGVPVEIPSTEEQLTNNKKKK